MIGLDTNVIVRLLANDDPAQTARARRAIASAEASGEPVLINDVVLVETLWTMRTRYRARRYGLATLATSLLDTPSFAFEDRDTVERASSLFLASSADFADCLIVAKNRALGARLTLTFDDGMRALPDVQVLRPAP